jgi:hypothetical protein
LAERLYIIPYDRSARKRHFHKTERGRVIHFVVQLEVEVEGEWKPVIRYDCAHDFVHRDCYNLVGRQKKEELNLGYAEALTLADEDIDDHWERYRSNFLKGRYP